MGRPKKDYYIRTEKKIDLEKVYTNDLDRLVSDCVKTLNDVGSKEVVYCFTQEQADKIIAKARYKLEVIKRDGYFRIAKLLVRKRPVLKEKQI